MAKGLKFMTAGEYMDLVDAEELEALREFVHYVATDWVESSHDKVVVQRDDYIRLAKALLEKYSRD